MRAIKPKVVKRGEEPPQPPPVTNHLVDFSGAPSYPTFRRASLKLLDINGGFQRFVVATPDGTFVPVVMLLPSECTPDIINHVRHRGCHVMAGVASEHLIIEGKR